MASVMMFARRCSSLDVCTMKMWEMTKGSRLRLARAEHGPQFVDDFAILLDRQSRLQGAARFVTAKSPQRPRRRAAHERLVVAERPAQRRNGPPVAGVAQHNRRVSK